MAKKWRYVQKSIYSKYAFFIFYIAYEYCGFDQNMVTRYSLEQIVNNKCFVTWSINLQSLYCPLPLSELEFSKKLYTFTQLIYWNWYMCTIYGFYALNFQSPHKKVFAFGRYHGGLSKELSIPHNFAGHFCRTFCIQPFAVWDRLVR